MEVATIEPMWPREVPWDALRFGVEIEFVEADPAAVALVPGWTMDRSEQQRVPSGAYSGAEAKPGKLAWAERHQIGVMFDGIVAAGGAVNWSCGLHVHVGLEPWGFDVVGPLVDATLATQGGLRALLQTAQHRGLFTPDLTPALRDAWRADPDDEDALRHRGRPQSSRCGVNVAAWYDFQTVEIRFPNATLDPDPAYRTVELCLRWVAAVGADRVLPTDAAELAAALGAPDTGYPPPHPEPIWHQREELLTELLAPVLQPMISAEVPGAQILFVRPTAEGFYAKTDRGNRDNHRFWFRPHAGGFCLERFEHVD